jgi:hypothetical protein
MTMPFTTEAFAAEHGAQLRRDASTARLARLARCCRPSAWARAGRQATQSAHRLVQTVRRNPAATTVCCAGT